MKKLIPPYHPVKIVNGVIEHLDNQPIIKANSNEDQPSYQPKMMLKVMDYSCMDNTYTSWKIEKAMQANINFMWLSNKQAADLNTKPVLIVRNSNVY